MDQKENGKNVYECDSLNQPVFLTQRLLLRPFHRKDIDWLSILLNDPEAMYFSPYGPVGYKNAQQFLEATIETLCLRGFGIMACCLKKEDGGVEPIGFCGVSPREIDGVVYYELGYRFFPHAWNKGYATEAARCMKEDVFLRLNLPEVVSFIEPFNIKSIRVAVKIGSEFAFHCSYKDLVIAIYRSKNLKVQ